MAEPTSTASFAIAAAGVGMATLLPGIDGNAIVGSFAGAALVALHAREVPTAWRVGYLAISWVIGYIAAPEVMHRTGVETSGVAAFLAASLSIAITVQLLERIKTLDFSSWLRRGGS